MLFRSVHLYILIDETRIKARTPKLMIGWIETVLGWAESTDLPAGPQQVQIRAFRAPHLRVRAKRAPSGGGAACLHAKTGLVDDRVGWIGSLNATDNSASYYEAISVIRYAPALLEQSKMFAEWCEYGFPITKEWLNSLPAAPSTPASSGAAAASRS